MRQHIINAMLSTACVYVCGMNIQINKATALHGCSSHSVSYQHYHRKSHKCGYACQLASPSGINTEEWFSAWSLGLYEEIAVQLGFSSQLHQFGSGVGILLGPAPQNHHRSFHQQARSQERTSSGEPPRIRDQRTVPKRDRNW